MVAVTSTVLSPYCTRTEPLACPANFPISYGDSLREKGFRITWKSDPFFEERVFKELAHSLLKITEETKRSGHKVKFGSPNRRSSDQLRFFFLPPSSSFHTPSLTCAEPVVAFDLSDASRAF